MRYSLVLTLSILLSGCSLLGDYTWSHPKKTEVAQSHDKAECLALASIVYGSNEDLLKLAKSGQAKPNKGVESDCLAERGYKRVLVKR